MSDKTELDSAVFAIYDNYTRRFPRQAQPEENLKKKARLDANNLPRLAGLRVLEVGPGAGQLAELMSSQGARVSLLDLVRTYLDQLVEVSDYRFVADIQNPFKAHDAPLKSSFDLITMCDVLEHVIRPGDALISARELLKPNGLLYVRSPSFETMSKYALANGCEVEMAHLRTYTPELLLREVRDSGLRVRKFGTLRTHSEPRLFLLHCQEASWIGKIGKEFLRNIRYGLPVRGVPLWVVRLAQRLVTRPGEVWVLAQKQP